MCFSHYLLINPRTPG